MNLFAALDIAQRIQEHLAPACHRIEIAGSIRRKRPEVKDIELVAIPKYSQKGEPVRDLFGNIIAPIPRINLLVEACKAMTKTRWIKPGTSEIIDWPLKPDGKYFRGLLPCGLKLDLFTATPDSWGYILAIRTGSAEFSMKLATKWVAAGYKGDHGMLTKGGRPFPVREEHDLFNLLYVPYVEPQFRI